MNLSLLQNAASCFPLHILEADQVPIYATLLERLGNSLALSQKALLSLDVAAVEQGTREQDNLYQQIKALYFANVAASTQNDGGKMRPHQPISSANGSVELRAAQARILHLGRVQAALLLKAQRALNFVTHLKAFPEATYTLPRWRA